MSAFDDFRRMTDEMRDQPAPAAYIVFDAEEHRGMSDETGHDPRHPDQPYDPDQNVRLGSLIDCLHLLDSEGRDEHPAALVLRLMAGRDDIEAVRVRAALLDKLRGLQHGDPAAGHLEADRLLLDYIGDDEVTAAFDVLRKWYE